MGRNSSIPSAGISLELSTLFGIIFETDNKLTTIMKNQTVNIISDKSITVLTNTDRTLFTILFTCILIISSLLNIGAIWTTITRNYRFFQKTCIISLSVSDLITAVIFSINNLELLSHPYINWTMGSFMCHFVPMCQSFGVILSSIALFMIAMDRYRNIVKALNKRWNPRKVYCLLGLGLVWLICAALSVPMFLFYTNERVLVIFLDEHGQLPKNYKREILYMCVVTDKDRLSKSFLFMLLLVFTPLIFVFFWFYFKIAQLIWRHRKPIQTEPEEKSNVSVTESSVITTSDTNKNYLPKVQVNSSLNNNKNEQMKKKLRTFKVIVILVINFIACRLPFWIFTIIKLSYPLKGLVVWRLNILIMALNVFNTILNPLFYTYLNVTLKILRRISKELTAFLCCFFSDDEFVEFEKGKSIFANEKLVQIIHIQCKEKMLTGKK